MNNKPAVPLFTDPNDTPNNLANPYGWNQVDASRGETRFKAPESNSTMVSDSVEMTKRLHAFVPVASVKKGRTPTGNNLGYENSPENDNVGDYKSKYTN